MRSTFPLFGALLALVSWHPAQAASGAPAAPTVAQVFKRVGGAVAEVRITEHAVARSGTGRMVTESALGSGVLISAGGQLLTAAHVVQTADTIEVVFQDAPSVPAHVVASDPAADVALLQLDAVPAGVLPVRLGNSDRAEVGDPVFVVGAPFGISHTLTVGHLSARRPSSASFGGLVGGELFQTDAAINHGNSGGPMFNMDGEVIGIVSHIVTQSGGSEGLGFAVTANVVRRLLLDEPSVWSGLQGLLVSGPLARALNVPGGAGGLLVEQVASGSPAERIGLRGGTLPATLDAADVLLGGDILLSVAGIPLGASTAYEDIRKQLIALQASGTPIPITVLRAGQTVELLADARRSH